MKLQEFKNLVPLVLDTYVEHVRENREKYKYTSQEEPQDEKGWWDDFIEYLHNNNRFPRKNRKDQQ